MLLVASLSNLSAQGSLVGKERFAKHHRQGEHLLPSIPGVVWMILVIIFVLAWIDGRK